MKTVEELIETKEWNTLTPEEKTLLEELVTSEEEFNQMKVFFSELTPVIETEQESVSADIKTSLDKIFQAKHPGITQSWEAEQEKPKRAIIPLYSQAWFRIAAILVLTIGALAYFRHYNLEQEHKQELAMATPQVIRENNPMTAQSDQMALEEQSAKMADTARNKTVMSSQGTLYTIHVIDKDDVAANASDKEDYSTAESRKLEQASFKTAPPAPLLESASTSIPENNATHYTYSAFTSPAPAKSGKVSTGLKKDLNPHQGDELTEKQRTTPVPVSAYFDLIVPSY